MLLLYKENNKLTFCEYDGDYVVLISAEGKKRNEKISRYNRRYSNRGIRLSDKGLTDGLGYRVIGFITSDNKTHRIADLLAVITDYRDLYDAPIDEATYKDMIGYNVPFEAEVVLAMDKTTNAFTFCSQREIDNPKARMNGLLTATRLYLPDGRLISIDNPVIIHDLHYVNLNKYVNAKPYEDVKKVTLEVLRANLKGVSGTTTSKQGHLPKYKEKELSNILKYSLEMFKAIKPSTKLPVFRIVYNAKSDFVSIYESLSAYNSNLIDCITINYKSGQVIYVDFNRDQTLVPLKPAIVFDFKISLKKLMQSSFPSLSNKTVDTVEVDFDSVVVTYTDKFKAKLVKKD